MRWSRINLAVKVWKGNGMVADVVLTPKQQSERAEAAYAMWYYLSNDSKLVEVIDGDIIYTPVGRDHSGTVGELIYILGTFEREFKTGHVMGGLFAVQISKSMVFEPDLMFIRAENTSKIGEEGLTFPPDLVVEVLSPSTLRRDRGIKFVEYAKFGVREYWLVGTDRKTIEVFELVGEAYQLLGLFKGAAQVQTKVLEGLDLVAKKVFKGLK